MANMEMIKFQGEMVAALQVVLMVAVMVVEVIMVMGVAVFFGYSDGFCGDGYCGIWWLWRW